MTAYGYLTISTGINTWSNIFNIGIHIYSNIFNVGINICQMYLKIEHMKNWKMPKG
jgi:hypothetical protein